MGPSRQLRAWIESIVTEGVLGAVGQAALAPARVVKAGVQAVTAPVRVPLSVAKNTIGGTAKAAGNLLQGNVKGAGQAIGKAGGNMVKSAVAPVSTLGKAVTAPVKSLGTAPVKPSV